MAIEKLKNDWKDVQVEDAYLLNNFLPGEELEKFIGRPLYMIVKGSMEETSELVLNYPVGRWVILESVSTNFTNHTIYTFTSARDIISFYDDELGKHYFLFENIPTENYCKVTLSYNIVKGNYCRKCDHISNHRNIYSNTERAIKGREHLENSKSYNNFGTCSLFEDVIIYHDKIGDYEKCEECKLRTQGGK